MWNMLPRKRAALVALVGLALVFAIGVDIFLEHREIQRLRVLADIQTAEMTAGIGDDHQELRMIMDEPGLFDPKLEDVERTSLPGSQKVIGVEVNGEAVAYSIEAMSDGGPHIISSFLGGQAVSVTYCNLVSCARVLTRKGTEPIDLRLGGQDGNLQMVFKYKGQRYGQESKMLPLNDHDFKVCSLRDWKRDHPNSRVFSGRAL